jgi:PKD repeat protein
LCVNFTDNSAGNIAQWAWDFGDFSPIVTTQNASHCYLSTGTFSPSLTVTSVEGCANTHVATGLIVVSQSPTASFTHTTSGLQGNFTGSITGGQPPYTIIFDPGDGSSPQNNIPASHTYPYDNNWLACVTVTDANGCSDTFCDTIHVVTTTTSDNFSLLDYDISVWPKPSSGLVNVSSAFHNIGNVVLFDLLGNVLYSTKSEARIIALDFSFIPKGVYIMNVQTEDGKIINTRIILQ